MYFNTKYITPRFYSILVPPNCQCQQEPYSVLDSENMERARGPPRLSFFWWHVNVRKPIIVVVVTSYWYKTGLAPQSRILQGSFLLFPSFAGTTLGVRINCSSRYQDALFLILLLLGVSTHFIISFLAGKCRFWWVGVTLFQIRLTYSGWSTKGFLLCW